ncbi:hypothetical protein DXG03_009573 [Asterophora parasitica]|uniref:Uncharacterized protein n=1 Tax=Asterophora parasitica TaxID=117018 RepID=A0A9P7GB71_9AGAR|nr:hypothetical protein DXG03_009573 [Asterophora parasitica]
MTPTVAGGTEFPEYTAASLGGGLMIQLRTQSESDADDTHVGGLNPVPGVIITLIYAIRKLPTDSNSPRRPPTVQYAPEVPTRAHGSPKGEYLTSKSSTSSRPLRRAHANIEVINQPPGPRGPSRLSRRAREPAFYGNCEYHDGWHRPIAVHAPTPVSSSPFAIAAAVAGAVSTSTPPMRTPIGRKRAREETEVKVEVETQRPAGLVETLFFWRRPAKRARKDL